MKSGIDRQRYLAIRSLPIYYERMVRALAESSSSREELARRLGMATGGGLQIDLLVRRRGQVLTLVECKFSSRPIGPAVVEQVKRKEALLKAPSSHTLERVLICAGDISPAVQKSDYFHRIVGLEAIF